LGPKTERRFEGLARAVWIVAAIMTLALASCWLIHVLNRESIGSSIYCGGLFAIGFGVAGFIIPVRGMRRPFLVGLLALVLGLLSLIVASPIVQLLGGPLDARGFAITGWVYLVPGVIGLAAGQRRLL